MNRCTTAAIIGLVLMLVVFNWSRASRDMGDPVPSFESPGVWIQLGHGFPEEQVVCQYFDDSRMESVIELTCCSVQSSVWANIPKEYTIETGRRLDFVGQGSEKQSISLSWMSASQRVALGIPLHPDKMTQLDWEFLPGVGEKLAAKIETNRQKNGDFGSLEGLLRIKGVGSSKIKLWKEYF